MDLRLDLLLPEFVVAGAALGAIVTELLLRAGRRARPTALTAALGLAVALVLLLVQQPEGTAMLVRAVADDASSPMVTGWRSDAFSVFMRALAAAGGLLVVLLAVPYTRRMDRGHGEASSMRCCSSRCSA
jgi:NADH:ubiquinone oxidoreductase subunit 2 (subunit N)